MKRSGFTLIEVLFDAAIIGLIAAMGIPAILNAYANGASRLADANIQLIENAKGMLQLPRDVFPAGRSLTNGTPFGAGDYTESNLMACVKIKTCLEDFDFKNAKLIPCAIGEKAYYREIKEGEPDEGR